MKPPVFAYAAPATVEECLELLHRFGGDAKIMAGGQSLMPLLNLRMARPDVVIDIGRAGGLDKAERRNGSVEIGATVRQRAIERDPLFAHCLPLLADAAQHIGHVATRSRGTIVGSLCHADPAAELPVCAALLDAEFVLRAQGGSRTLKASAFFADALATTAREDELVEAVRFPVADAASGYAFVEMARRHGDFALVSVAGTVRRGADGKIADGAVALGGVGPAPAVFRLGEFSAGAKIDAATYKAFGRHVASAVEPRGDLHASADYRRAVAATLVERVLRRAENRAEERASGGS